MDFEILAPAGNMDMLVAGVRCGANAVYLGTTDMNARRNAGNFTLAELDEAVRYCHSHGVKVYMTANTLVSDSEMMHAYDVVKSAMNSGVDGFIVQDLGLAKMIHDCFPDARLHASTQCSVNTPDGIRALADAGFCRAVIPREMSADEIRELRDSTDMELEIFVHGALCMSVSGQCYMSAMLGSRSGNRGLCAQPCRLAFSADNSGSCDLSLKDLSLIKRLSHIHNLGVVSLKIEGRMKRPEYVAAAVTACRKAIDNDFWDADEQILRSVFSRSGFTDGYFTGKREDMFGTRQKEDVVSARDVLKDLSHLYDNENPLLPLNMVFTCVKDEPIKLVANGNGNTVTVLGDAPEIAINKPMTEESLRDRLAKTGGTPFYASEIFINLDDGLIVPASRINDIRRRAIAELCEVEIDPVRALPFNAVQPRRKAEQSTAEPYFTARFGDASQVPDDHPFERLFIPIWSDIQDFARLDAGVEIPRGLFGMEEKLKSRLVELKNAGVTMALCSNLGAYRTCEDMGFEVFGDFGLNVFNSTTASQINSPILSFELTLDDANSINAEDTGIIGYGKLPLMLTRNCPIKNKIGCAKCKKQGVLTDRKGFKFPVKCSPYPCVEVLNPIPLYMADRMDEIHTDFVHLYFTDESRDEVEKIVEMYKNRADDSGKHTRGLYYRGVM